MYRLNANIKKLIVDTDTPVSIYLKLRDYYPNSVLLESSDYGAKDNSYAYVCCNPIAEFDVKNNMIRTSFPDNKSEKKIIDENCDLLIELKSFMQKFDLKCDINSNNNFITKAIFGYQSYSSVEYFEKIELENSYGGDEIPIMKYRLYENIIVINTFNNEAHVISYNIDKKIISKIISLIKSKKINQFKFKTNSKLESNIDDEEYKKMVEMGIKHCMRGDVFQIVLSRKFYQDFSGDEFTVYRHLRSINPSPYLFYFDYGDFKIFGSSPEAQLIINDNKAEIHPIAGTFKRTGNDKEDKIKATKLFKDNKENSEHMMLVDLARNDLSRSCSNVKVEKDREIQFYSHVIHLVSKVTGKLKVDSNKIIGETFPAGTLTGAPKHMAMQLIEKYESSKRSFYGGAIGFISFDYNYNHAIIIRSFLSKNKKLYFQAGAGIVSKSSKTNELNEVYNKVRALKKSIEQAENYE
ncbi:anthranilate synthase component I family protein [Flavobacteriales bacterium]|nr:anthranilate synthase component I family protein [Flavobacteriales bacterium]